MVFSSLLFIYVFFVLYMAFYFAGKSVAWKNSVLIVFSLVFYAWGEPVYIFLMLATAVINFFLARLIQRQTAKRRRKLLLIITLAVDFGLLGVFKYAGFVAGTLNLLPFVNMPVPVLSLPIGISFYTFQISSYIIDVYRGDVKAQRSFPKLLLFITLFHQLVAGPIVRYAHIAAEIDERRVSYADISAGIGRFITGLAKKSLLANPCGELANNTLSAGNLSSLSTAGAWLGIIMFTMQIYFDFSAYSDMAIGMGRMVGFHFHENFSYPYISRSVAEFWRRWHISLGTFFRDYVYIPLGGNRRRVYLNLLVVWALTGLWHGASWNFVLWGLYFFVFIACERLFLRKILDKIPRVFSHLYLLLVVIIGWVFFYFESLSDAFLLLSRMFGDAANLTNLAFELDFQNNVFFIIIAALLCTPIARLFEKAAYVIEREYSFGKTITIVIKGAFMAALLLLSTISLAGNSYNPFIYYRF